MTVASAGHCSPAAIKARRDAALAREKQVAALNRAAKVKRYKSRRAILSASATASELELSLTSASASGVVASSRNSEVEEISASPRSGNASANGSLNVNSTHKTLMKGTFERLAAVAGDDEISSVSDAFVNDSSNRSRNRPAGIAIVDNDSSGLKNPKHETSPPRSSPPLAPPEERESAGPTPESTAISEIRLRIGRFVNSERIQGFVLLLIIVNSIMLGVATFPFVKDNQQKADVFEDVDLVFLILFTIELGLQFIYHGMNLFLDGWLFFDFVVVTISWVFLNNVTVGLRAFRIFRALRVVTRIQVMRNLVVAIFSVVPKMAAITMLLLLIFYIFAVMFTQLFKDMHRDGLLDDRYFDRLDFSMFTLFQIMCMDEWSGIAYDVMEVYSWAWATFISFIFMTGFVVVNLMIAVICDAIQVLRAVDSELLRGLQGKTRDGDEVVQDDPSTVEGRLLARLETMDCRMDDAMRMQVEMIETMKVLSQALRKKRTRKEKGG